MLVHLLPEVVLLRSLGSLFELRLLQRQLQYIKWRKKATPYLVRQRLNCRGTESHQSHHGYVDILYDTQM